MFVNSELFLSVLKSKYKSFALSKPLSTIYQVAATDSLCCYLSKWSDFFYFLLCLRVLKWYLVQRPEGKLKVKRGNFEFSWEKKNVWSLILAKCLGQRVWNSKITKKKNFSRPNWNLFSPHVKMCLRWSQLFDQLEIFFASKSKDV